MCASTSSSSMASSSVALAILPNYPFQSNHRSFFLSNCPQAVSFKKFNFPVCTNGLVSMKLSTVLDSWPGFSRRFLFPHEEDMKSLSWRTSAVGSGLESSIADPKGNVIKLKNVTVVLESGDDDDKIKVRVDIPGEDTQKAFDIVLANLARTAPPIPGFRRTKGGKTSNVPKSFLLQILGRERVTKFVIQEILSSTMADYVEKENLKVKNKFRTTQTAGELESAFAPGSEFGFNAIMEIDNSESEATASDTSEE